MKEIPELKVTINGNECSVRVAQYQDRLGRPAIVLWEGSEPYANATVNMPQFELKPWEVIMKGYSENAGIPEACVEAGLCTFTGRTLNSGFVEVPVMLIHPDYRGDVFTEEQRMSWAFPASEDGDSIDEHRPHPFASPLTVGAILDHKHRRRGK